MDPPALPEALSGLCDRCLGRRLVGARGVEAQREAAATARGVAGWGEVPEEDCPVCEGSFSETGAWVEAALAALEGYVFGSFQVGTVFPRECEMEEASRAEHAAAQAPDLGHTERLRTEANRLLSQELAARTGAEAVPEGRPDVAVVVDTRFWTADARANPVFVRGRYTKHRRDVPQTHWPCRRCQGRGCWECDGTGVRYSASVEDAIGQVLAPALEAAAYAFHGAGREDIDALMLGDGRPFVLELKEPRRRTADLGALEAAVNAATPTTGVGVRELEWTSRDAVAVVKQGTYDKEYVAHCVAETPLDQGKLEKGILALAGLTVHQRTPERVAHRRADLVRERTVHEAETLRLDGRRFSIRVRAESGTYIKEMVSGDDGRTRPSLSEVLGVPVTVEHLDVLRILDR